MFAILLIAAHLNTTGSLTLAWDPNPPEDHVHHYVVSRAPACPGDPNTVSWTDPRNVGNVTQFTYPDGVLDLSKPQCFTVQAVDEGGLVSGYAEPAVINGDVLPECAAPLGQRAIGLFAGRIVNTTGSVGSRARLEFQVGSPGSPVTMLSVKVNDQVAKKANGDDLEDVGSLWFRTPTTPGTYPVVLEAFNQHGCTAALAKGADGKALTVTVK